MNDIKRGIPREQVLSCKELARIVGKRRGGRPTKVETVYRWINEGLRGVRMSADFNGISYEITYGDYLDWRRHLGEARERARQRRLEAVRGVRDAGRRAQRAKARLAAQGAI